MRRATAGRKPLAKLTAVTYAAGMWRRWFAFALTVLAVLAFLSWRGRESSIQQHDSQQTEHARQRAAHEVAPVPPDERIADYTEMLALFTALLGVVAIGQAWFLWRAEKVARVSADAAKAAADAAVAQTAKMGEWAEIAEKQMLIAGRQTDIQEKQHAVSRIQFFATHYPRLVVRYIHVIEEPEGEDIEVGFSLENVGASDANVIQCRIGLQLLTRTHMQIPPPYENLRDDILRTPRIKAGEIHYFTASTPGITRDLINTTGLRVLCFLGWIEYADSTDIRRKFRFCRRYLAGIKRFERVDDPEYEPDDQYW